MAAFVATHEGISTPGRMNPGWRVTLAGTGVNLALGILYSWSIIAAYLRKDLGWTAMQSQVPYMVACGVFALLMVPGGRLQDKVGPRAIITVAAVFAGLGFVGSSYFLTVVGLAICFGVLFGAAMGLGYSSTTPPAMKWFDSRQRGLVVGVVVAGFGLASVYAAPLANYLIGRFGLAETFLILGLVFFAVILALAQFITNPPAGYVPPSSDAPSGETAERASAKAPVVERDFEWREMVKDPRFFLLWFMFCFGSLAGLMIIGQLSSISTEQSGIALGFVLVAILAVFNAGGRVAGGMLFDRLGQTKTLMLIFGLQGLNFLFFAVYTNVPLLLVGTIVAGSCYGACLAVFPATTASLFGIRNLGMNYGLVFTAWGAGGVFGGLIGGMVRDMTGSYVAAFLVSSVLCFAGMGLAWKLGAKREAVETLESATA